MSKRKTYARLRREMLECELCPLHEYRTNVVVDRGCHRVNLCFIGEAPGATEDRLGEAFIGAAGQELDTFLARKGLTRNDYIIINTIKCRPPGNRYPGDTGSTVGIECVRTCTSTWLDPQIEIIDPRVIVLIGKKAAQWTLFRSRRCPNVGELVNNWYRSDDYPGVEFLTMYHPAYLLRKRNEDEEQATEIERLTRRTLARAIKLMRGKTPKNYKPTLISKLSFKQDKRQGTLFS